MRTRISQRELRNDSGAIMRRVEAGESFVVTRNGTPVADLLPHSDQQSGRRRFVPVGDVVDLFEGVPAWDTAAFVADQAELDAAVDDGERDPWDER